MQSRLDLRVVAVADGLDEQVLERSALEGLAEDIEDLAVVGLGLLLDLQQELGEDHALAGVGGDEVPQVADLGLADPVDATEPLLDPVRVPRQVVVDHQVGALQVQALARSIGRDQHPGVDILREQLHDLPAFLAPHPAVDRDDRVGTAKQAANPVSQVLQGVPVLSEDDDLPHCVR